MDEAIRREYQEGDDEREDNVDQQVAIFQFLVGQEPSYEAVAEKDHKEDDRISGPKFLSLTFHGCPFFDNR